MHRRPHRETLTFHATTWSKWAKYAGSSSLVLLLVPLVALLLLHFGVAPNRWTTAAAFGFCVVWAMGYRGAIQNKPALVTLDQHHFVAGGVKLSRANLSCVLARWVDGAYGTTTGSALTLTQGAQSVTLGCRGGAPASDGGEVPATTEVALVLAEADFRALAGTLGAHAPSLTHGAHAPSPKHGALSVNLVPSTLSARGLWRNLLPLLVVGAVAEVVGLVGALVLHLPEIVLAVLAWAIAAGGMVGMLAAARRPPRPQQKLRIQGDTVTWLDGKREAVLAECALEELAVERRRFTRQSRFGNSVQLCLILRFPNRRELYFGLSEGSVGLDERFRDIRRAPSLLVGRGEWDALVKRLAR